MKDRGFLPSPEGAEKFEAAPPLHDVAQANARFLELFPVSEEKYRDKILGGLKWKVSHHVKEADGYMRPIRKYTQDQLEQGEWEQADYQAEVERIRRQEVASSYFMRASGEFNNSHAREESVIRLDQEDEIFRDLQDGTPVLVRGYWRMGKSSMMLRMQQRFGAEDSIYFDVGRYAGMEEDEEQFRREFGLTEVAEMITNKEFTGEKRYTDEWYEKRESVEQAIDESGEQPFAYLNNWLGARGENVFVGLDEVIEYAQENPELLPFFGELAELTNLRLAIVLHHVEKYEDMMRPIFARFKQHYIRSITEPEARAMIDHGLRDTEIQFTDGAVAELMEMSGGRPMEINHAVGALLQPSSSEHDYAYDPKLLYTESDIKRLFDRNIYAIEHEVEGSAISTYEKIYKMALTDEQKELVAILANEGNSTNIGEIPATVTDPLLKTMLIVVDQEDGTFKLNGKLLQRTMAETD